METPRTFIAITNCYCIRNACERTKNLFVELLSVRLFYFGVQELLADTVAFREKALALFGDFLKYTESFLKQGGPPDCLRYCTVTYSAAIITSSAIKTKVKQLL